MERTEPALVPEWLRCSGNVVGGGASARHSDVSPVHSARSRLFRSNGEKESPRFLDRSSSSNSRHSLSNNGSSKHPYSSFTRSHLDKNREREKEKSLSVDIWNHSPSDPLASILTSRAEKSGFKRSQSLVSRKLGEVLPHRVEETKTNVNNHNNSNGVLSGVSNRMGIQKSAFEKDFPSLGSEQKQDVTSIRRVSSPGLSSAIQSLPVGNSGFLGGEKWTSALAEVPTSLANNCASHSPLQQSVVITSSSATGGTPNNAGLNMAEALSQPPARVRATPEQPDKNQRLEELAIKQSRQLIPMTHSMPKLLVLSSGDKLKQPKILARTNETTVAYKGVQPQPHSPHLSNQSRAGHVKSDSPSTSHFGKFLVLKPGRENGVTTATKDASNASSDTHSRVPNGHIANNPSTPTVSTSPKNFMVENKVAALSPSSKSTTDKRSSQSLARSRSEFFNLMRRKTSPNASGTAVSSTRSLEMFKEGHAPISPHVMENGSRMVSNGTGHDIHEKSKTNSDVEDNSVAICPDEEEAAFLRSLGWEENSGEDGLTEEEINAFYQEYMNRRPSLNVCTSSEPKCSTACELHAATSGTVNSDSSSSESEPEV